MRGAKFRGCVLSKLFFKRVGLERAAGGGGRLRAFLIGTWDSVLYISICLNCKVLIQSLLDWQMLDPASTNILAEIYPYLHTFLAGRVSTQLGMTRNGAIVPGQWPMCRFQGRVMVHCVVSSSHHHTVALFHRVMLLEGMSGESPLGIS